jgi:hypothetical protein
MQAKRSHRGESEKGKEGGNKIEKGGKKGESMARN